MTKRRLNTHSHEQYNTLERVHSYTRAVVKEDAYTGRDNSIRVIYLVQFCYAWRKCVASCKVGWAIFCVLMEVILYYHCWQNWNRARVFGEKSYEFSNRLRFSICFTNMPDNRASVIMENSSIILSIIAL